jgi:nitroimidazol reductase NimA-like FMN-containing flavoprotein (pyridoxamine 5'-phosphate oxidase superfamily)
VEVDRNGFEVLPRAECFALLASVPIGRIGLSMAALPVVLPVNFAVDGERLVLRTVAGSKLDAALEGSVVAFEADRFDPSTGEAWSVLVRGSAGVVTDADQLTTLSGLSLDSWGADRGDQWVTISSDLVSGRRTRGRGRDHGGRRAVASAGTSGGTSRGDCGPS